MPAPGWGRKAAEKFDKRLEDDLLFKEIGGQLDDNFDYSSWQRTRKVPKEIKQKSSSKSSIPWSSPHVSSSDCLFNFEDKFSTKQEDTDLILLKLRVNSRKKTIQDYQQRAKELQQRNKDLSDYIHDEEKDSLDSVKILLRKYERLRKGGSTLNKFFTKQYDDSKASLEEASIGVNNELAAIQKEIEFLDDKISDLRNIAKELNEYKDKEYPIKELEITNLTRKKEYLIKSNKEEEEELDSFIQGEVDNLDTERKLAQDVMRKSMAEKVFSLMPEDLHGLSKQNNSMKKEIAKMTSNIHFLEEDSEALEKELKSLKAVSKKGFKDVLFPEIYSQRQKFTPDMDVVLDIPTLKLCPF